MMLLEFILLLMIVEIDSFLLQQSLEPARIWCFCYVDDGSLALNCVICMKSIPTFVPSEICRRC